MENLELSVPPVPETSVYTGDVTSMSAVPSVPTTVPAGRPSSTVSSDTVTRGVSLTLVTSIVNTADEVDPSSLVARNLISNDVSLSKSITAPGATLTAPVAESIWHRPPAFSASEYVT